ncbi:MAG: hypothetical protein NTW71_01060 [Deltaproteobacteria bacterium]|nr:hypothetical protein [Deltaproteobacteria bacterium]
MKARTVISQIGHGRTEKTQYRGMPTSVPAVPGARGASPLPKPVASILTNLSFRVTPPQADPGGKLHMPAVN